MEVKHAWVDGSRIHLDVEVAASVCSRLEGEGRLSASELVNESRDESSPLHDYFEWDDTVAAEKYREVQASKLIRSIIVVSDDKPLTVRAFPSMAPNVYRSIQNVMSSDDLRARMLNTAMSELDAFKRKYQALSELAEVFAAIDKVNNE